MYITVKEAAEKWGISERRVRVLCADNKIPGAYQEGRGWKIPADAEKPLDGRYRTQEENETEIQSVSDEMTENSESLQRVEKIEKDYAGNELLAKGPGKKTKRKIRLWQALLVEALILVLVCAGFIWGETRITQRAAEKKLLSNSRSTGVEFENRRNEVGEISDLYARVMNAKVNSIIYYVDHNEGVTEEYLNSLCDLYGVEHIYLTDEWTEPTHVGAYEFYAGETADGRIVAIQQSTALIGQITTDASVGSTVFSAEEGSGFYVIFLARNGYILESSDEAMGTNDRLHKITEFGIEVEDLDFEHGKWLTINGNRYFVCSYEEPETGWITLTGISYREMTGNIRIVVLLLAAIIGLILTIQVTYSFFWRQEGKRREFTKEENKREYIISRLQVYSVIGLVLIGLATYYVQTLYFVSLHSVGTNAEEQAILLNLEKAEASRENLTAIYNREYLSQARVVSRILSDMPELRTKENLAELSKIFGLQYIMMFDENGRETLSDSDIFGFEISDDPESQSYAFNVLKYGISYVIQEPQGDDLTGEYHQFIGVPTTDKNGRYDGFLQICVSPNNLHATLEEISFENILYRAVSKSEDGIIAVDKSGTVTACSFNESYIGLPATSLGFSEDQIRSDLFGYVKMGDNKLFADSFEAADQYIYIVVDSNVLYTGRITMVIFTVFISFLSMMIYNMYFNSVDVRDVQLSDADNIYVDVTTATGDRKRTLNIISRLLHTQVKYTDMTPDEKTSAIVKFIVLIIGLIMGVTYLLRGVISSNDDSVFSFIASKRWNRGFNVFALTDILIFLSMYTLVMTLLSLLIDQVIRVSTPKTETMVRLIRSFIRYLGAISVIYYSLSVLGFDSQTLLASAGLLTLVIGLGAKDLVTDILAGIFIIFENEFQVGDIIEVNNYKGRVLEIGIRTTRIMNTIQDVKSINNRNLTNIVNKTKKNSYCDVIINVPFNQDIDAIEEMLKAELPKIKEKSPYILNGPSYGGIDDMSARVMRLSIRTECLEEYKFDVRTLVNKEIKDLFDRNGFTLS